MSYAVWLADDDGAPRERFSPEETIFVAARGLAGCSALSLFLVDDRDRARAGLLATYVTDRHGTLPPTVLVPQPQAETKERRLTVRAAFTDGKKRVEHELAAEIVSDEHRPAVFASDEHGRLQTGMVHGEGDVAVTLRGFAPGCVRVFLVPRQFGWRVGDPIVPARKRDGSVAVATATTRDAGSARVRLAASAELSPGSYQFIARAHPPGWFEADEPTLLRDDVVSNRRFASLVVRASLRDLLLFDNGIVLTPHIAGRPLAHQPYFRFVQNFPKGTDVYAALDPDALPPGIVTQRAAIYVIAHKTAAQWSASNALTDISGPGMTPAVKIVPIVAGCVNWNTTLVWPNPQVPGKYDIAIDFGNNAANPSQFATDGTLDSPLDMIDGYVRVGFYVTEDPSLPGPFAGSVGQHDYNAGTIDVPSTDAGPNPTDSLPLTATIRYPAQAAGVDAAAAPGAFPLAVIMHGNSGMSTSYLGYNYLLDHLASWGFIAMSIYAPTGVMIETRARAILAHLNLMSQNNANPGLFHGHVDLAHIGILGHSRGAEAVVRAARINTAEALGWNIGAGISIAPTDYHHYGAAGIPLLVIYGANDGDVSGTWPGRTGFNIYDETGRPRSFIFVYGATHDRFNTEWASIEAMTELTWDITQSDLANLISLADHENVAKGYVTAFLQAHLQNKTEQLEYFGAGLKPSLAAGIEIHASHQLPGSTVVDDFQQHNPAVNTLGGAVTPTALPTFAEDALRTLDGHSPHVVAGGDVAWQSTAGVYLTHVPAVAKDVSGFTSLSFRVSQKYESAQNPAGQAKDLHVRLTDGAAKTRAIRVSMFADVPYPYVRGHDDLVKSALKSVRIPLASYKIANLGADDVDLTNVVSVAFEFNANASGELDISDIEFEP